MFGESLYQLYVRGACVIGQRVSQILSSGVVALYGTDGVTVLHSLGGNDPTPI